MISIKVSITEFLAEVQGFDNWRVPHHQESYILQHGIEDPKTKILKLSVPLSYLNTACIISYTTLLLEFASHCR